MYFRRAVVGLAILVYFSSRVAFYIFVAYSRMYEPTIGFPGTLTGFAVWAEGYLFLLGALSVQQIYCGGSVFLQVARYASQSLLRVSRVVRAYVLYVLSYRPRGVPVGVVSLSVHLGLVVSRVVHLVGNLVPRFLVGRVYPTLDHGEAVRSQYGVYYRRYYLG